MAKVSKTGYKKNSKDKNEPALVIPSNKITMKDVEFPVFGIDDMGYSQMMYPGMDYNFPGGFVYEIPMAQSGGDISVPDLSDKGWLSKYQKGGTRREPIYVDSENDPRYTAYADSLSLYNAMIMQDRLMGPGSHLVNNSASDWTVEQLKDRRVRRVIPGMERYGAFATDFQNQQHQFEDGYNFWATRQDEQLINYYKSLGFNDSNIMYHSSPDLVHPTIRPIGTYFDGSAESPKYKKPVQPVEVRKGPSKITPREPKFPTSNPEVVKSYIRIPDNPNIKQTFGNTQGYSAGADPKSRFQGNFNLETGEWNIEEKKPVKRELTLQQPFKEGGWLQKYQIGGGNDLRKITIDNPQESTRVIVPNIANAPKQAPAAKAEIKRVKDEMEKRKVSSPKEVYAQEKAEAEFLAAAEAASNKKDTLKADTQSDFDKASNKAYYIASNPMDAFGHYSKYGYVPQGNIGNYGVREDASAMSSVVNSINPFSWLNAGTRLGYDLEQPETYTTSSGATEAAWNALEMLPMFTEMRPVQGAMMLADDAARAGKYINNKYVNIAEGANPFDYAWRSPAARFDDAAIASDEMADVLMPTSQKHFDDISSRLNLTDEERKILKEYEYDSKAFTGRGSETIDKNKRAILDDILKRAEIETSNPLVMSRRVDASNPELFKRVGNKIVFDRPTSWSAGRDALGNNVRAERSPDRIVTKLPSGKNKVLKNPYEALTDAQLEEYKQSLRAKGYSEDNVETYANMFNTPRVSERELLLGPNAQFKQIGKVKNKIGGYDYIVKPIETPSVGNKPINLNLWGFGNKKVVPQNNLSALEKQAFATQEDLTRANRDAEIFSQSLANRAKLQEFRPGQDFSVTNQQARFIDDPEALKLYESFKLKNDPTLSIEQYLGNSRGSYGARDYGDLQDVVLIDKNQPFTSNIPSRSAYTDAMHETTHSRSIRLGATDAEKKIASDAWSPMIKKNNFGMPEEEAFAVQNELRTDKLKDIKGDRVYTEKDIPEIKKGLQEMINENHEYLKGINVEDFNMSALIKSLNKIGLGSVIIGAGAATQQKYGGWLQKYQKAGQVNPELTRFMSQKPQDDLRAVNINAAPAVSTSVNMPKPKGNPVQEDEALNRRIMAKYVKKTPKGFVAREVPGALGSMQTVYENPQTGEKILPGGEAEVQQAIMDRREDANKTFNNIIFPTGAGAFYGLSNIASGNLIEGALELAGTLPIPFLKGRTGNKPIETPSVGNSLGNYQKILDKGLDIHDVRLKYHNNMILDFDEMDMLHKFGKGAKKNYERALTEDVAGKMHVDDAKPIINENTSRSKIVDMMMGTEQGKVAIPDKTIKPIQIDKTINPVNFNQEATINVKPKFKIPSFYSAPYQRTSTSRAADKWLEDWFYNPETKQKFLDYGGTEGEWQEVLNTLENPIKSNYLWGKNQPGGVYVKPFNQASIPLDATVDIGVHEGIHKAKLLLDNNNPILHRLWNDFTDAVRLTPSEAYPEIFRFRQKLGLKPGQTIDLKTMEDNLHLISDGYSLPYKIKDKNKLLEIINNAPAIVPPAAIGIGAAAVMSGDDIPQQKYGGWINKYQNGGDYSKIPQTWKDANNWTPNVEEEYQQFKKDPNAGAVVNPEGFFGEETLQSYPKKTKYPDGGGTFNKSVNKKGNLKTSAEGYYAYINGVNLSNGGSPKLGWLNKYNRK